MTTSIFSQEYKRGETITLPASIGIDETWIGKSYKTYFTELDANRLFKPTNNVIEENGYRSKWEMQTDELRITSTFNALSFISSSSSEIQKRRYAVITVYKNR